MDEKELNAIQNRLRSSTIGNETIDVIYLGNLAGFHRGKVIKAEAMAARPTGRPYPYPKWQYCDYRIEDVDGDYYTVSSNGTTKFEKGFYPVGNKILNH